MANPFLKAKRQKEKGKRKKSEHQFEWLQVLSIREATLRMLRIEMG